MKPTDKAYQEAADEIRFNSGLDLSEDVCSELAKIAVDAAYAAQFPPSEDYAGLVKMLRSMHKQITSAIKKDDPWEVIDETVPSKAADALEAVLAGWDAEREHYEKLLYMRTTNHMQQMKAAKSERDALAARLAPVDDEALVEIVAREIAFAQGDVESPNSEFMDENWHCWEPEARAAISAIRPHIEAAERERCAKAVKTVAKKINVAPHERPAYEDGYLQGVHDAAAAIRRSGK